MLGSTSCWRAAGAGATPSTARWSRSRTSRPAARSCSSIEWLRAPGTLIPADPDPAAVVALLTIAFGASSTANLLLMASVRRVPAGRTSAALLLTPISSAIIAAVVLGERLTPVELFGAALILAGIAGAAGMFDRLAGTRRGRPPTRRTAAARSSG